MFEYVLNRFGIENLELIQRDAGSDPGPGEVAVDIEALSLNYRDLLVIKGAYNPRLKFPMVPLSDGAGVVSAVGDGVTEVSLGDRVVSHFVSGWVDGPYQARYGTTTLGSPGPGVAAERVILPASAWLPIPTGYDFAQASTLPIAALTAWSALKTEGSLEAGQTVLTLGTGGVSIFACQLAKAMGARVIVTSSSDEKLERVRELGADETINYRTTPRWEVEVLERTGKEGVDLVVENGGVGTLGQSLRAVRAGGTVALLGALTGLKGEVNIAPILMKRVRVAGIMVDSRVAFSALLSFLEESEIEPVIDVRFSFDRLADALAHMEAGKHFGKIVLEVGKGSS